MDSVRSQSHLFRLEEKVNSLKMDLATARASLAHHVDEVRSLEATVKEVDDIVVVYVTSLEAHVLTVRVGFARRVAECAFWRRR